jgi:GNAT superfamily N-acetyltransferase
MKGNKVIKFLPLIDERWEDLVVLFGKSGAFWGCWCMYWRLTNKEFNNMTAQERKEALLGIVQENKYVPGLIGYVDNVPAAWIGFGPRSEMGRLVNSRVIPKVDEKEVLSIVCFFVHKDYRGEQLTSQLLEAAIDYSIEENIPLLEAYPVNTDGDKISLEGAHCGISSVFSKSNFEKICDTRAKSGGKPRILMRLQVIE